MIRVLMKAGEDFDVTPYGTEALGVMRIEKGHAAGNELCGTSTAQDLGMGRMLSNKKDFIGHTLSERPAFNREDGFRLMGFKPIDQKQNVAAGAHLFARGKTATMENDEGWLTSAAYSPELQSSIALGFIKRGQERLGEVVVADDPMRNRRIDVEIVSPHFIDPEGERLRA
ncbi:MAG: glycine cleavage T C-terminal barrel domain-containing protein, partial [Geminicoccaceae bacterium]